MPKLYHVFVAHDFPDDQEYCSLCVARSIQEAEETVIKDCAILPEDKLEVLAYEITDVDGYDVVLFKQPTSPKRIDYLDRTLSMIGLETMMYFQIVDEEFQGQVFWIDSFGDVFVVDIKPDVDFWSCQEWSETEHEYLTLGRILTQYYDKIFVLKY